MARALLFPRVSKVAMAVLALLEIGYAFAATALVGTAFQGAYLVITIAVVLATSVLVIFPLQSRQNVVFGTFMLTGLALTFWALGSANALGVPDPTRFMCLD